MLHRRAGAAALFIAVLAVLAACTPHERALWVAYFGPRPEAAFLAPLRKCESNGNYGAVSRSGTYRGAYQFSRATWNATARRHYPEYVGLDPARATARAQDEMALALWDGGRGRGHWPVCGKRV